MMLTNKSSELSISQMASISESDASAMIGKTVTRVDASEYSMRLEFSDGSQLEVEGHQYADSALDICYTHDPEQEVHHDIRQPLIIARISHIDCPNCQARVEGFVSDPRGASFTCDSCNVDFFVPIGAKVDLGE